ncbi:MAG: cytochrome c, class [Deltaproteobacteria bacterium]|nr:cytochrome c, class [Deltaproteobacteria bacterium]
MVVSGYQGLCKKGFKALLAVPLVAGMVMFPVAVKAQQTATEQPASAVEAVVEAAPVEVGDANVGKALFTGETRFANAGPACMSCHSAGVGALDGGNLGPNLTKAYVDESKNPLLSTAWVNGGGSPTMGPIFAAKNITEAEMENLRAFLKVQGANDVAPSQSATFAGIGIIGFIAILILFTIIWSGRYSKRTKNTAHDALWRNYGGKGGI